MNPDISDRGRKAILAILVVVIIGVVTAYAIDPLDLRANDRPTDETDQNETPTDGNGDDIMVTDGVRHIVPLDKIRSGGPGKDGIPSIDNPKFISAQEADEWLEDDDLVLGITLNGEAKAYPHRILVWHEIVNDEVGGTPVAATYCPLCFTGAAFLRVIDGEPVEFGVSGKLYNSDLVMYDRKTDSYWSQILGKAIVGELAGQELERIPMDTVKWENWKQLHPDTLVLSQDTGFFRDYDRDPYGGYYNSSAIYFPVDATDDRLHNKAIVYGVEFDDTAKAYPAREVKKAGLTNDEVAGRPILVVWDPQKEAVAVFDRTVDDKTLTFELRDGRLFDKDTGSEWSFEGEAVSGEYQGERLDRVVSPPDFWFAWVAFHPETELFQTG